MQLSFNPIDFGFRWTEYWYEFDYDIARKLALKARNAKAKELKAAGCDVWKSTHKNNLMSRGGIGSGHPHIEVFIPSIYVIEYCKRE